MSVKNYRNSLRSSVGQKNSIKFCENHADRYATHQLIPQTQENAKSYQQNSQSNDQYFCQKCSIMLASQGFNVYKLVNYSGQSTYKDSNSQRKQRMSYRSCRKIQIQKFMNRLQIQFNQLVNTEQFASEYLMQAQNYYGNVMKEVSQYFKHLQQIIQLNKYKVLNNLLSSRTKEEEDLRQYRTMLAQCKNQINSIIEDIEGNMQTVQTTSQDMYSAIMSGYTQKLNEIQEVCQNPPQLKELSFCLRLPQVPVQLQKLSDNFQIFYPEDGMPQQYNQSYNFKPIQYRQNNQHDVNMTHNTRFYSNNNSLSQDQALIAQNYNVSQSEQAGQSSNSEISHLKQNNKNIMNTENELKRSFGGSLGFSFQESQDNLIFDKDQYKLKSDQHQSSSDIDSSDYTVPNQVNQICQLSKISEMINSKQILQSRQSLGKYLNLSHSREASVQDTQTLLV